MKSSDRSKQAMRAIVALLLRNTLGKLFIGIGLIATVIAILSGYNASTGMTLLWYICYGASAVAIISFILFGIIYAITAKRLPKKLDKHESDRIHHFIALLTKHFSLRNVPIVGLLWKLLSRRSHTMYLRETIRRSQVLDKHYERIKRLF